MGLRAQERGGCIESYEPFIRFRNKRITAWFYHVYSRAIKEIEKPSTATSEGMQDKNCLLYLATFLCRV